MTTTPAADPVSEAADILKDIDTIASAVATISTASAWTAIVGLLTALPGLVQFAEMFMSWANSLSGNNPEALISELGTAFNQLVNAKTESDHAAAAKTLSGIFSRLPS